jgi:hypothetical protein
VKFYLGAPHAHWLASVNVPLFISNRTLIPRRKLPRAIAPWALDSGGYTELSLYGEWTISINQYVAALRRYRDDIGQLQFAAAQDYVCTPRALKRSGRTVADHVRLTVDRYIRLREVAQDLPIAPVLQGVTADDFLRGVDGYTAAGVDLRLEPIVLVGSIAARGDDPQVARLLVRLRGLGLRLHTLGVKHEPLARFERLLESSDSMAWSREARGRPPLPGCESAHVHCTTCPRYALLWRARLLDRLAWPSLFGADGSGVATRPR